MTTDFVPCKRVTAEHIRAVLGTCQYVEDVPWTARQTAKFPLVWTKDNAAEFTRCLRECDQRVIEFVIRTASQDAAKDFLDLLGDLQLPREWLKTMQQDYTFLHKCLDIGQPVLVNKSTRFDLGHYAIIKTHPNATRKMLNDFKPRPSCANHTRPWDDIDSIFAVIVISLLIIFCVLATLLIAPSINRPQVQSCPEPQSCPGLEAYSFVELMGAAYDIASPTEVLVAIVVGFVILLVKVWKKFVVIFN